MISYLSNCSIRLVNAKGPALFERLFTGYVRFEADGAALGATVRIASLVVLRQQESGELRALVAVAMREAGGLEQSGPAIAVSCDAEFATQRMSAPLAESYDLTDARTRLALLARLASLAEGAERTARPKKRETRGVDAPCALYEVVIAIIRGFDLHLTLRALARRVGISTSTLRRWFSLCGRLGPARFMDWVRMLAVVEGLAEGATVAMVAHKLGFLSGESVRRTLRRLVDLPLVSLRSQTGLDEFATAMSREFRQTPRIRARVSESVISLPPTS